MTLIVFDDMIADMLINKKFNPILTDKNNKKYRTKHFYSFYYTILHTILLWKFQANENFKKLHLNIHQILTFKALWIFMKSVK